MADLRVGTTGSPVPWAILLTCDLRNPAAQVGRVTHAPVTGPAPAGVSARPPVYRIIIGQSGRVPPAQRHGRNKQIVGDRRPRRCPRTRSAIEPSPTPQGAVLPHLPGDRWRSKRQVLPRIMGHVVNNGSVDLAQRTNRIGLRFGMTFCSHVDARNRPGRCSAGRQAPEFQPGSDPVSRRIRFPVGRTTGQWRSRRSKAAMVTPARATPVTTSTASSPTLRPTVSCLLPTDQ